MVDPRKILLFNSGLPGPSRDPLEFSLALGPWTENFTGRNIGNGYIAHATLKAMFGAAVKVDHVANAWTTNLSAEYASYVNEHYSHLIFVMQDFIRKEFACQPFYHLVTFLEQLKIPVVPISLGANCLNGFELGLIDVISSDQIRFLQVLSERSAQIGVRGEYTADILNKLNIKNVKITGCPSYFENKGNFEIQKREFNLEKIITTGSYFSNKSNKSMHLLQDELYFINALYLQPDKVLAGEATLDNSSAAQPFDARNVSHSLRLYELAFSHRLRFFTDFNAWRQFYKDDSWCLTVGTRLHSGIQSFNSGVPAVVTNGDARSRETCEYLGIPWRPELDGDSSLEEIFTEINLEYIKRKYAAGYSNLVDYFESHGMDIAVPTEKCAEFKYPNLKLNKGENSRIVLHKGYSEAQKRVKFLQLSDESAAYPLNVFPKLYNLIEKQERDVSDTKANIKSFDNNINNSVNSLSLTMHSISDGLSSLKQSIDELKNEHKLSISLLQEQQDDQLKKLNEDFYLKSADYELLSRQWAESEATNSLKIQQYLETQLVLSRDFGALRSDYENLVSANESLALANGKFEAELLEQRRINALKNMENETLTSVNSRLSIELSEQKNLNSIGKIENDKLNLEKDHLLEEVEKYKYHLKLYTHAISVIREYISNPAKKISKVFFNANDDYSDLKELEKIMNTKKSWIRIKLSEPLASVFAKLN